MKDNVISLGSTERFGVTVRVFPEIHGVFGNLTLWAHGKHMGPNDEPMAVYPFLCALESAAKCEHEDAFAAEVLQSSTLDAWARLHVDGDDFRMPSTEFFDSYEMYCVSNERTIRYLWKDRSGQSTDSDVVHDATLSRNEVEVVVQELRAAYERLAAPYL